MKYFKREEMARCFRRNGARCRECPLIQPAEKLPDGVEANLEALVTEVLDPARERLGRPIVVNSGYRCPKHNATVGGVANSQHMRGEATDVSAGSIQENARLAEIIEQKGKYDQLIRYLNRDGNIRFIHVSWKRSGPNRKQKLRKV